MHFVIGKALQLLSSTTFRAAAAFAVAGIAYALANLLLARQLPVIQYAYIALFLAFLDFGAPVGTGGADTVVVRYRLAATLALLRRVLAVAVIVGTLVYLSARYLYGFSAALAALTAFAVVAAACNRVAASIWQSMQRFRDALMQLQSSHVVLVILAVFAIVFDWRAAFVVVLLHALYIAGLGTVGWSATRRVRPGDPPGLSRYPWRECVPIVVIAAGAQLAMQTERFLIPQLLAMEDLATYGVLAAVAGSPFQMLSIAVGYTLLPRLQAADTVARRNSLLKHELVVTLVMTFAGAVAVWALAPWVARLFVGDRFELTGSLVAAAMLIGFGKVGSQFLMTIVKALGTTADLNSLSVAAWLGLGVSVVAAWALAGWSLPGLLLGVACGWAVRVLLSLVIASQVLRTRDG